MTLAAETIKYKFSPITDEKIAEQAYFLTFKRIHSYYSAVLVEIFFIKNDLSKTSINLFVYSDIPGTAEAEKNLLNNAGVSDDQ